MQVLWIALSVLGWTSLSLASEGLKEAAPRYASLLTEGRQGPDHDQGSCSNALEDRAAGGPSQAVSHVVGGFDFTSPGVLTSMVELMKSGNLSSDTVGSILSLQRKNGVVLSADVRARVQIALLDVVLAPVPSNLYRLRIPKHALTILAELPWVLERPLLDAMEREWITVLKGLTHYSGESELRSKLFWLVRLLEAFWPRLLEAQGSYESDSSNSSNRSHRVPFLRLLLETLLLAVRNEDQDLVLPLLGRAEENLFERLPLRILDDRDFVEKLFVLVGRELARSLELVQLMTQGLIPAADKVYWQNRVEFALDLQRKLIRSLQSGYGSRQWNQFDP